MNVSRKKILYGTAAVLVLACLVSVFLIYDRLRDVNFIRQMVVEQLQTLTHRQVELGSAELDWSQGLGLRLNRVRLVDPARPSAEWSADKVWVAVRPLPLLRREILIRRVTLEGLALEITREADGRVHIGEAGAPEPAGTPGAEPVAAPGGSPMASLIQAGLSQDLTLRKGRLRFVDRAVNPGGEPLVMEMEDIALAVSKPFLKMHLTYRLEGRVKQAAESPAPLKISGEIRFPEGRANPGWNGALTLENLSANELRPYLVNVFGTHPENHWMSLALKLERAPAGEVAASGTLDHGPRAEQKVPVLKAAGSPSRGRLEFVGTGSRDTVTVRRLRYQAGDSWLNAQGRVTDLSSAQPGLSLALDSSELQLSQSNSFLPWKLLSPEAYERVRLWVAGGGVTLRRLEFSGRADQLSQLARPENRKLLKLDVQFRDVDLGPKASSVRGLTGDLSLEDGTLRLNAQDAQWGRFPLSAIRGSLDAYSEVPIVKLEFHSAGELAGFEQDLKATLDDKTAALAFSKFPAVAGNFEAEGSLSGPLGNASAWDLTGEVTLRAVSLKRDLFLEPVTGLSGQLRLSRTEPPAGGESASGTNWLLTLKNLEGRLGQHGFSEVGGECLFVPSGRSEKLHGKIVLAAASADALASRLAGGKAASFLKPIQLEGGELTFVYQSAPQPRGKPPAVRGTLEMKNLKFRHRERFRPLQNLSGKLVFDGRKISIETREAFYGDSPLHIKGGVSDYGSGQPRFDLTMTSPDFMSGDFTDIPFLRTLDYRGPARVEMSLRSRGKAFQLGGKVDLSRTSYQFQKILTKPAEVSNHLEIAARIDEKGLIFDRLAYELADTRIEGRGTLLDSPDAEFSVNLAGRDFDPRRVAAYVQPLKGSRNGKVDFELEGRGRFLDLKSYEYKGRVLFKQVVCETPRFPRPIQVDADMKFVNNLVQFRKGHLVSGRTDIGFEGNMLFGERPVIDLRLMGKSLFLSDWIQEEGEDRVTLLEMLAGALTVQQGSGKVHLAIGRFRHKFWDLENISADLILKDRVFSTENMVLGRKGKNHVMLQGRLDLSRSGQPALEALVMARKISVDGFMGLFGDLYKDSLTGQFNWLKARVTTTGRDWKEFRRNLNGTLSLDLENGRLHTGKLLLGAVTMFGFEVEEKKKEEWLQRKPGEYLSIRGDFNLVRSVAHTEDFVYATQERKMSLVGDFDLHQNTMDTVVGVAPLAKLDKILTQIPVVGDILTAGDEQSLIKTYYAIKGPFNDPKVDSVPLTSLEKKVVGIFQGIFQANPKRPDGGKP